MLHFQHFQERLAPEHRKLPNQKHFRLDSPLFHVHENKRIHNPPARNRQGHALRRLEQGFADRAIKLFFLGFAIVFVDPVFAFKEPELF